MRHFGTPSFHRGQLEPAGVFMVNCRKHLSTIQAEKFGGLTEYGVFFAFFRDEWTQ